MKTTEKSVGSRVMPIRKRTGFYFAVERGEDRVDQG
jgi:hypothetical protein